MTTTATLTETRDKCESVFSRGDLVRFKDSSPNNYVVMVTRTAEPGDVTFHGVIVHPAPHLDLGRFDTSFNVSRFAPFYGTIELQSK